VELPIEYACRTELVAIGRHVVVRIIDGHRSQMEDFDRLAAVIASKMPKGRPFGVLHVSWHGTPQAAPAVQRHAAKLLEGYADEAVVVVALLGVGFWSASFTAALAAFAKTLGHSRINVETNLEAATQLLARELVGINAEALASAYEALHLHMRSLPRDPSR
jgi:hypothetical protein